MKPSVCAILGFCLVFHLVFLQTQVQGERIDGEERRRFGVFDASEESQRDPKASFLSLPNMFKIPEKREDIPPRFGGIFGRR